MVAIPTHPRFKNLTGQRFGYLVVQEFLGFRSHQSRWSCLCDCGTIKDVAKGELLNDDTQSCGCWRNKYHIIHGLYRTAEFHAWDTMIQRCTNLNHPNYQDFGGRGITVCQQLMIPETFLSTVGQRPSPQHSLDRIDNNGSYTCGQCADCLEHGWIKNWRWATKVEQMRNTRRNVWITISGVTKCAQDWANSSGISRNTLVKRFYAKWPEHELLIPVIKGVTRLRHSKL